MLSDEEYRSSRKREWHEAGKNYHALMGQTGPLNDLARQAAEQVFKIANLRNGDNVLDVGTGPGSPALDAWPLVAPNGKITGIDFAASMIEAAKMRVRELGIPKAEFYEMEGEKLDFPDDTFDVIISRYAYPHFTNAAQAFKESFRVLRKGGRLAAAMHGDTELNPYFAAPVAAMSKFHRNPYPLTERGPFGLSTPGKLEALIKAAGFSDVKVHAHNTTIVIDDFKKYWDAQKKGGAAVRRALDAVPDEHKAEGEKAALAAMEKYVTDNRGVFPAQINVGYGVKR